MILHQSPSPGFEDKTPKLVGDLGRVLPENILEVHTFVFLLLMILVQLSDGRFLFWEPDGFGSCQHTGARMACRFPQGLPLLCAL